MGDTRFGEPYQRLREASDRVAVLIGLEDDEVVQALAHASRERDPMLANVLATEAFNRMRRARTAFNHLGEGLIAIDLDGRITSVNPTACRDLRASAAELLSRTFDEAVEPRGPSGERLPPGSCAVMRALGQGIVVETESEWFVNHDGEAFPVSVIAAPIREEGIVYGAVATFLDITARRASEARRAAIIEASLDSIITFDEAGIICEFNAAAERTFGLSRAKAVGARLESLLADDDPEHHAAARDLTKGSFSALLGQRLHLRTRRADATTFLSELALTRLPGLPTRFAAFIRDLSREQAAQAQAREAAARYEQLVAASPLSTQIFTPDGTTIVTNRAWERLWGVTLEQLGGYNLLQDPQLEKKGIANYLRRALAGETVYIPPVLYDPAEENIPLGRARWVEAHAFPLRDSEGRVEFVVLFHDDVTDRVEAGQRTALTQSQAQMLIENIRDIAICMLDADGRVVSWNAGSQRMNGYEAEEIVGQHIRVFHTAEGRERRDAERALETARNDGTFHGEGWLVRKDGTRYWGSSTLTAIRKDNKLVGFAKVVRDLTERKKTEDLLVEQERMYRDLVENSPEPMGVHAQGKMLFLNSAAARLLGARSPAEIVGRNVMDFVAPESRELVIQRLRAMMQSPDALPPVEETLLRIDGSPVEVETVALPIRYEGKPAAQLILRDITHRKLAEATLRKFNAELEQRVAERTRQLQQALRDVETFANGASHDLRAPLRGAGMLADEIEQALARGDVAEAQKLVRLVKNETSKASQLVHDLLSFAKSGHLLVKPELVEVTPLARELADELHRRHPERGTKWQIDDGMRLHADPALLRIALYNLLANASKYSASTPAPIVSVSMVSDAEGEALVVQDNGIGFPSTEAARLFAPFQRLSSAQGIEGTGLGLVTVHRIATRHGGRVTGESHAEKGEPGARFTLWLPRPPTGGG